jgi:sec-independent protein translocase protein TatB
MGTPPTIELASLGMADSLILMVLALVVFGPRRLPQIGRQIGKLMYEFRKASNDFKFQMEEELRSAEDADRRKKEDDRVRALAAPVAAATTVELAPPETTIESSYPSEANYSSLSPPVIQPPHTGEQVSADRPRATVAADAEVEVEANIESDPAPGALPDQAPAEPIAPEQAAHHG